MTTCPKCGAYIPDGGKMCISCGWKPEEKGFAEGIRENPFVNYLQEVMDTVVDKFPKEELEREISENMPHDNYRWYAAASYIGPAFIYTYYKYNDSELVRYHANQACLLFIAKLLSDVIGKVKFIGKPIHKVLDLALFALAFNNAKAAVANKQTPVPVLGQLGVEILK